MNDAFLQAGAVRLSPPRASDATALAAMPEVLRPREGPREPREDGEVRVTARLRDRIVGSFALDELDWTRHGARVVARWDGDAALGRDALAAWAAYARDELNLDWLEADPATDGWREILTGAGWGDEAPLRLALR